MSSSLNKIWGSWCAALVLGACSQVAPSVIALEPGADAACALDGMVLKDFPGPKAQILYAEGRPDYYCDLMELFAVLQAPEQKRKVAAIFVQDMAKADWEHPSGHWIAARGALFVVGSKKAGSMGPTFGAFSTREAAAAFVQLEGGNIVAFDQITPAMLSTGKHGMPMAHRDLHLTQPKETS
ncbi:MAG: nitrous oxide reductase accessory protein NosL [Pseudomonadota bacterium]